MKSVSVNTFPPKAVLAELNQYAERIVEREFHQMGYPFDQEVNLCGFYQWLVETKLCGTTLINVGDPFKTEWDMLESDEFERRCLGFLAKSFGFPEDDFWGVLTNGGTDGNMHGVYFGRKFLEDMADLMELSPEKRKPILYVSSEAHYSVRKLGDVLQIETRMIDAHPMGQMDAEDFRRKLDPERPALVVIAIGGTFKGAIDDQEAIEQVLNEVHPPIVYRHLDAALFGGYLPWVEDERVQNILNQKLRGFDSLAVSGHKFLSMNEPLGIFICRKEIPTHLHSYSVPYLNGVIPTISCSRSGFDALKLYWRITTAGEEGFRREAAHVLRMTRLLEKRLNDVGVKTWVNPYSTTVCMERPASEIVHRYAMACGEDPVFGKLAHVVVMQFFNEELIETLVSDIARTMSEKA